MRLARFLVCEPHGVAALRMKIKRQHLAPSFRP
jgi:hypothetical protein